MVTIFAVTTQTNTATLIDYKQLFNHPWARSSLGTLGVFPRQLFRLPQNRTGWSFLVAATK